MKRGKFIVLEGGERAGKGTAVKHLKKMLPERKVVFTREPGGSEIGEVIRREGLLKYDLSPLSDLLLFFALRAEHMEKIILPEIKRGRHVICERWSASTYAYQIVGRDQRALAPLFRALDREISRTLEPDLYVYCSVPPEVSERRIRMEKAKKDRIESAPLAFHRRVRKGYDEYLRRKRSIVVDAELGIAPFCQLIEAIVRAETGL